MPQKGKNTTRPAGEGAKRPKSAPAPVAPVKPQPPRAVAAAEPAPDVAPIVAASPVIPDPETPKGPAMTSFENVATSTRDQFEKASQNVYRGFEDYSKFQKDNWEAFVAASQIAAKGAETIGRAWMALTQEAMENAASTAKALIGAKTLREAVDLQQDFAKTNFDKFVAESTKLSEIGVKVANEAFEPITARVNVAVEKILKPVAA
jgi:phasin family protein